MGFLDKLKPIKIEGKAEQAIGELDYQQISKVGNVRIDVNSKNIERFPDAFDYFKHRIEEDFARFITISHEEKCDYILRCNFHISTKIKEQNRLGGSLTYRLVPVAKAEANMSLINMPQAEVIYKWDKLTSYANIELKPRSAKELSDLALRRLSAILMANFITLLSKSFLYSDSPQKAIQLLLKAIKTYGNIPTEVETGFYANPYGSTVLRIFKLPNGDTLFENEILEDWGLYVVYRELITQAVLNIGESVIEPLIDRFQDENFWMRQFAVYILGQMKCKQAVEPLMTVAEDDPSLSHTALEALSFIGDPRSYDYFIRSLAREFWPDRVNALRGLANVADKRAIEVIANFLKVERHDYTRKVAKEALKILKKSTK